MSYSDIFYKNGEEIRSSYLKTEINLDNVEKGHLQLCLRPYEEDMLILRKYYDLKTWSVSYMHTIDCFTLDCFYNDIDDSIEFNMFNGFDIFIFNICALLGIGTLKTNEKYYALSEKKFAHIYQKVSVFYLTLEEFKKLDGFIGKVSLNGSSIYFQGLILNYYCIHESVQDGDEIPDIKSDFLKGGGKLFLMD